MTNTERDKQKNILKIKQKFLHTVPRADWILIRNLNRDIFFFSIYDVGN